MNIEIDTKHELIIALVLAPRRWVAQNRDRSSPGNRYTFSSQLEICEKKARSWWVSFWKGRNVGFWQVAITFYSTLK